MFLLFVHYIKHYTNPTLMADSSAAGGGQWYGHEVRVRSELLGALLALLKKSEKAEPIVGGANGEPGAHVDGTGAAGAAGAAVAVAAADGEAPDAAAAGAMRALMADPTVAAALQHPKVQPVLMKVMADPSILSDPLKMQAGTLYFFILKFCLNKNIHIHTYIIKIFNI